MTIRLRPHHFLCLLTYAGRGYSPSFTANYDLIAVRLSQGEEIEIVEGPDDVCAPLLAENDAHCWRESVIERDMQAASDIGKLGIAIETGGITRLNADLLGRMRAAFGKGLTRPACAGCEWSDLCSAIAARGFEGTRVQISEAS